MASYFIKSVFKSKISSALGTNDSSSSGTLGSVTAGGVKWDELNYPPCSASCHLIHYSPASDSIPVDAKQISRLLHTEFKLWLLLLMLNFIFCCVLAATSTSRPIDIFSSLVRFVLCSALQFATFYCGYKAVAGEVQQCKLIYTVMQVLLCIWMLVCAIIASGSIHGFKGCADESKLNLYRTFCALEATAHLALLLFACWCLYRVWTYPGHAIASRHDAQLQSDSESHAKSEAKRVKQAAKQSSHHSSSSTKKKSQTADSSNIV